MTASKTLQQLRDGFQGAGCDDEVKALTKAIKALELVAGIAHRTIYDCWICEDNKEDARGILDENND